jgi:hypothetical protein
MNALDPRLVDPSVKSEPKATPPLHTMDAAMMHGMHRNLHPSQSPYAVIRGNPITNSYDGIFGPAAPGSGRRDSLFEKLDSTESPRSYTYPEPPRRPRYTDQVTVSSTSPVKPPSTPSRSETAERQDVDNSKLKGVLWPGMSIFDSATPTARRRRNQKKDASILEQLEASSLDVEPTEHIWTPGGDLKKERVITGHPHSSSSPWRSSPAKLEEDRPPLVDIPIRKPYFGRGQLDSRAYDTYADELVEDSLNYSALGKRKRPFHVHNDHNSEPEDEDEEDHRASLVRPAPMTYLTRGLGKENEQVRTAPMKHEQQTFASAFSSNPFERQNSVREDDHQYRTSGHMNDYHQQSYTSNLFRLADAAATSTPFPTTASMPNSYNAASNNPYGLACPPQFIQQHQINNLHHQYQYQMQHQHPAVHTSSHMRAVSATAGPMHARSLSNGMQNFGLSLQQHLNGYNTYGHGHGHAYQPMDQPSMFPNNGIWAFGANNGMYDHGTRSACGSAFDNPTPGPMPVLLAASPTEIPDADDRPGSPGVQKMHDQILISHEDKKDTLPAYDALSDKYSCGQPEGSEDEGKTITAPGTPYL